MARLEVAQFVNGVHAELRAWFTCTTCGRSHEQVHALLVGETIPVLVTPKGFILVNGAVRCAKCAADVEDD